MKQMKQLVPVMLVGWALLLFASDARGFYHPGTGRWLSRDPIGERGGLNRYGFIGNTPVSHIDRLGLAVLFGGPGAGMAPNIPTEPPTPKDGAFSVPSGNDSQKNLFDKIAKDSADEWTRANTAQEMFAFMQRLTKDNCCIRNLTFSGHGWGPGAGNAPYRGPGIPGATAGSDGLYENGVAHDSRGANLSDLGAQISSGKIRFCKPCLIQIHSCRISRTFIQSMASLTKCKVVAASSSCRPYPANEDWWQSVPGVWEERTDQGGGYNGFWESDAGALVREIGPVYEPR